MGAIIAIAACCLLLPLAWGVYGAVGTLARRAKGREKVAGPTSLAHPEERR